MNRKLFSLLTAIMILACLATGCGETNSSDSSTAEASTEGTAKVAGEGETVPNQLEIPEDAVPIYGTDLKDGVYDITVDSSSSMFNITDCQLTVADGSMTANMTMGGTGYLYVFMGKGEDATDESQYIPFVENADGTHSFQVPVEALDMSIDCAAYSKKKEQWYDRTLLFRADSLPSEAFSEGVISSAADLSLEDGTYTVNVTLEGGSGRATVQSPAKLTVEDGAAFAEIIWSSPNYDYMLVDGERIEPENTEGNAAFVIPVTGFDYKMPVAADTTAMSTPHEIEYTLYFDSTTIQ